MKFPQYMMATKAIHKLGDISRDMPDLCVVRSEEGENYIGEWVTGFGFIRVKFPKTSTRNLTKSEIDYYKNKTIQHSAGYIVNLDLPPLNH